MRMWIQPERRLWRHAGTVRGWRRGLVAVGIIAAASFAIAPSGASAAIAPNPVFHAPQAKYLALGDSLAFGYQEGKLLQELGTDTYSAASFNTGYDADFAAMIAPLVTGGRSFTETNYGCPGET